MACRTKIVNITNGCKYRLSHAERAVRNCAAEWVEFGVSIRSLTLAESIQARSRQAVLREPMPYSELFGLKFKPTDRGLEGTRLSWLRVREADEFMSRAVYG